MIICICRGASEGQIHKAVDAGATCLGQLQAAGIGDQCGACVTTLRDLLSKHETGEHGPSCSACPNQRRLAS